MDNIRKEKSELRKLIKGLKKVYSFEQKKEMSMPIWEEIETKEWFKDAKVVLMYWSMKDEYQYTFKDAWNSIFSP